ncbi:MAG TPA: 4Fe-4S dicluster domain-containing protein [Syntrophales bacterium]|nr:4Fe-4S dicluster domain-containing protein [Syntrophales bacterium]HQN77936.1 4Fe-4S dicluster domain-containing protein [Syntrophales bacterium]HQQ28569.1 4Fe-4S dicluster domain-containing protein [Syntrophales bacterium]
MENAAAKLREEAKKLLAAKKVDVIIGYEKGTLPLQSVPSFIEKPEDADKLVWDPFCSQNLAKFAHDLIHQHKASQVRMKPEERKKKVVGIVARGCTTRSMVIHLQEKQYGRDEVVILGVPCTGYVSKKKAAAAAGGEITGAEVKGKDLVLRTAAGEKTVPLSSVLSDSCLTCRFNNPVIVDVSLGEPAPPMNPEVEYEKVNAFEKLPEEERWAYFTKEMAKCMKCYACRNTCPSCYCKVCFAEQNQPAWIGVSVDPSDTQMFQLMRIFHMAGRCVDCGSCIEVCPMGVDLRTFLKKLDKDGFELFNTRPGADMASPPPLSAYSYEDKEEFIYNP